MGRFANAIGIWELKVGPQEFELKPKMKDVRSFRKILTNDENRKDKDKLFDKFAEFMFSMLNESFADEDTEEDKKDWIEININPLLERTMVAFHWTTDEEIEKSKKESIQELKKEMSSI